MANGQLNLRTVKLGDNADTSKNFLIEVPAVADGSLSIKTESGTDVLAVDASGNVAFPSMPGFGYAPIIESGSVNGDTYLKFADGTLINLATISVSVPISTAYSAVGYRSTSNFVAFATPFISSDYTLSLATNYDSNVSGVLEVASNRTLSGIGVSWTSVVSQSAAFRRVWITAIGRWK